MLYVCFYLFFARGLTSFRCRLPTIKPLLGGDSDLSSAITIICFYFVPHTHGSKASLRLQLGLYIEIEILVFLLSGVPLYILEGSIILDPLRGFCGQKDGGLPTPVLLQLWSPSGQSHNK